MTENEVLERLKAAFPDGIIYNEEYRKKLGRVTIDVRRCSRAAGQSSVQWLAACGFTWKETGYVETDMLTREAEVPVEPGDVFTLADGVFKKYPLAGEYVLTDGEAQLLYQSASQTVQKVLRGDTRITVRENVVLVLETIELLKNWSSDLPEEGEEPVSFWDYVFLQYGFQAGRSDAARSKLYDHFCKAVRDTLGRYKRFFAPAGKTQRYYTTLLLHALAPRRSIEGLFNILFSFYVENLDFQYVQEDTSYKQFTKGMRARWNSGVVVQDDLQLRSDAVFSGLQTLFNERPGFMAVLCDGLVERMDALLRGEEGRLDPVRNGWDLLLVQWYRKKSSAERSRVQGERRPLLWVFQNGAAVHQKELRVTGNDLCLTTRSRFLPLRDMNLDFNAPPRLRVEITYLDKPLYDSGRKLERDYLLFDSSGNDRTVKTGRAFLFAGAASHVEFSQEEGILQLPHPGQLYRLDLDDSLSVAVDGREVFAGAEASAQFRRHALPGPVRDLRGLDGGGALDLFRGPFALSLVLPQGENPLLYRLSLDGESRSLKDFQGEDGALSIPSAPEAGAVHSVRLVDIRAGLVRYEYRYAVLPGCAVCLDKPIYRAGVDEAEVVFSWNGRETRLTLPVPEGESVLSFSVPELDFTLELDLPEGLQTFQVSAGEDKVLEEPFSCPDGRYAYRVTQKSGSVFVPGPAAVLYRGDLLVGEADALRFQGREVHVHTTLCWDFDRETLKSVEMRDGCGILCGLTYADTGHPPWEETPMLHYTATLYFEDARGQRHPFNGNPDSKGFELVNPVHVWLVNDQLLILQCHDEDGSGVYIDTRYNTIVNRSLDGTVPRKVQQRILDTPDYFEYIVTKAQACQ